MLATSQPTHVECALYVCMHGHAYLRMPTYVSMHSCEGALHGCRQALGCKCALMCVCVYRYEHMCECTHDTDIPTSVSVHTCGYVSGHTCFCECTFGCGMSICECILMWGGC